MRRTITILFILFLCGAAALCVPSIRRAVLFRAMVLAGFPLDEAGAQVPHVGQCKGFTLDDPIYDYVIYYFDGAKAATPTEVARAGLRAIRRRGFEHTKKMTLVVFCNLTSASKSTEAVYPFGLYLESEAIRSRTVPIDALSSRPLVKHPMNWDRRINEWVYITNNAAKNGPEVAENTNYVRSTNALDRGWFMALDDLTNRAEVYTKFGTPRYYVRELGTYSEVYPVEDADRGQAGTVRIWYEGDRVTNAGCYMENK